MSRTSDDPGQLDGTADEPPGEMDTPPYHKEDEKRSGLAAVVRETVVLVVVAVGLAIFFKTFLVAAFYIPSGSMESTLNISDRVLVEKVSYSRWGSGEVTNGDVIVFVHDEPGFEPVGPSNPVTRFFSSLGQAIGLVPPSNRDFIKRVVGVPGDKIDCDKGKLVRNDKPVDEPYLDPDTQTESCKETVVKAGQLFVMGDNRTNSQDSRVFGVIDDSDVVGRAFVRIWPLNHIGWLRRDR